MRKADRRCFLLWFAVLAFVPSTWAQNATIRVSADLREAPRRIFHAHLEMPVKPGPLALLYPKWIPGEHAPDGPISELVGLKLTANGKTIPWRRDDMDLYMFHLDVPTGATTLEASYDYLSPLAGEGYSAGPTADQMLTVLEWNLIVLYPAGVPTDSLIYQASLRLPQGWKFASALTAEKQDAGDILFSPVSLTTLVDSPVLAGQNFRSIALAPDVKPPHHLNLAADSVAALAISDEQIAAYSRLVREAGALFGARHYDHYDFLVSLTNHFNSNGVEHHQSSDDRVAERTFINSDLEETSNSLLSHEFTHSWNGKYRRPAGLATPDFEQPMKDDLLWIYEGLTQYIGESLSARSGLRTQDDYREALARVAAYLDWPGRTWRSLEDTSLAAPFLYDAGQSWESWRRGVDFYDEGWLVWLEADILIRQQSKGQKSLDDFCRRFYGPPDSNPKVVPYTLDDVIAALNAILPYDWRGFFETRVYQVNPHPPLGGIDRGGWKLVFNDQENTVMRVRESVDAVLDLRFSVGLVVQIAGGEDNGRLIDVIPGTPAADAGLAPGMRLLSINGRGFTSGALHEAIAETKAGDKPIVMTADNTGFVLTFNVQYHGGERYPHLVRNSAQPDLLSETLRPLTSRGSARETALENARYDIFNPPRDRSLLATYSEVPMKHLPRLWFLPIGLMLATAPIRAQQKHPLTFDDLISVERISEPMISPDGLWVAYTVAKPDLSANRLARNIWVVSTNGTSEPRQLTRGGSDGRPRWSPDSKRLAFVSSRSGTEQIYLLSLSGGEGDPLTTLSTGAGNEQWSPDGRSIAFTSSVYPDCHDDACNHQRDEAREKDLVKARIYDHLLFRHWTHWSDGKRSHLFVIAASGGAPRDLTAGADYDVPPDERGDASDIVFSPDSREICFTAVTARPEAASTNGDLFTVALAGGEPRRITVNPGFDGHPIYSPDGRSIAYDAQFVAGYESDRWRLMLYDRATQKTSTLTEAFDASVQEPLWSPDGRRIYFVAEDKAEQPIYAIDVTSGSAPRPIAPASYNSEISVSADGKTLAFTRTSLTMPAEVFTTTPDGERARQLTHHNSALLSALDMNPPEPFWFEGADGARVEGLLIRPPHFDASKKYPLLFLVHGGPQGAWDDAWGYRWNEELFASPGYVAVMINPRGSTGYGQKFVDDIRDDWGGKVYDDLMKGADYALAHYPFIDSGRTAAAGGSYGGYMMDWFATHTDRFKALISHAGPYDNVSMYGGTEELWFIEHDLAGTPWSNPEGYSKWSPSTYAAALGKFKTPTLVIAGEMDFRVPYTQSLEFFTDLQRQNVPSKLLIFPDEGHWIGKPQNSRLWYKTFFDWLATYLK